MLSNGYIKRSVQKAFLKGLAGCIEHTTSVYEALKDAKSRHRSICMSMLDIANAYGSVKHNHVQFVMEWYHVPKDMREILFDYYEGLCAQVRTDDWFSEWIAIGI